MEHRLTSGAEIARLSRYVKNGDRLDEPVKGWFAQLTPQVAGRMGALLGAFFAHGRGFDYRDCSLGNLVFAGAYLEKDGDFNEAAAAVSALVGRRARLLNVAEQQNRILVGLKQDGSLLANAAALRG